MVKIKTISRSNSERIGYHRNFSKSEHRFGKAREYTRALKAAKLEHLHAKPFVKSLDGHVETVSKINKCRNKLPIIVSGDWNGEIRCWNVSENLLNWRVQGHKNRVLGISITNESNSNENIVISTGIDNTIKLWKLNLKNKSRSIYDRDDALSIYTNTNSYINDQKPVNTIYNSEPYHCIDCNWEINSRIYATGSSYLSIWDISRNTALHNFDKIQSMGLNDHIVCNAFNPTQYNLIAVGSQDRKITFYDIRTKHSMPNISLLNWANEIKWNPINSNVFVVATNDWSSYTFDIRHTKKALRQFRGHIDAVTSVDWSPTGNEFVTGSTDGHIRIWNSHHQTKDHNGRKVGYSRELYKGKRMYNIYQVRWSNDSKYIFSGSADGTIRIWKAFRAQPLYKINKRYKNFINYNEKLKKKYEHMSEIGLIYKFRKAKVHQRIPRNGVYFSKEKQEMKKVNQLKRDNKKQDKIMDQRWNNKRISNNKRWKRKPWASRVVRDSNIM